MESTVKSKLVQYLEMEIEYAEKGNQDVHSHLIIGRNPLIGSERRRRGPRYVSIGPLHWNDPNLRRMQDYKLLLIKERISSDFSFSKKLNLCLLDLEDLEEKSRSAYPKIPNMTSEQFVVMLFLDAYFIIHRLVQPRISQETFRSEPTTSIFIDILPVEHGGREEKEPVELDVDIDLIMLDNQIPFFVIECVWNWLKENRRDFQNLDLLEVLGEYLQVDLRRTNIFLMDSRDVGDYYHVLDFLYCGMILEKFEQIETSTGWKPWIPSATELKDSGMQFRLSTSHSILDINFKDGVLQIPTIRITESQLIKLENLIDFEQSKRMVTHFSNFVGFMSCLLCDEKDVRIISRTSIIENRLGSDKEVQKFFKKLRRRCGSYWDDKCFLGNLFVEVNNYEQSNRNKWKATVGRWKAILAHKFCSHIWLTLSVIGAILLFILTLLQTFFTIYSHFHPPRL